jgi:hypothetical protein
MDSVCRVLLFVFCMGIIPAFSQSSRVPSMSGLWSGGSVNVIDAAQGQECPALVISEDRIRLNAIPGTNKFEGVWIRTPTNTWITTENRNCRWFPEDSSFQPIILSTRAYLLDAVYDPTRGVMNVDGRFANCDGNGCGRFAKVAAKTPFHTELRMNNDQLIDTNLTDDSSGDWELVRVNDLAGRVDRAETALATWLKLLDAGEFGRFYDQATTVSFRSIASRKDFINKLTTQRDRVGTTMSRQALKTMYAEHAPFLSKASGEYVLFWNGVESTKSARESEFLLLVDDGGTWKVAWLNYGA